MEEIIGEGGLVRAVTEQREFERRVQRSRSDASDGKAIMVNEI